MNRKELYLKTVDLLLDAYNSEKLEHGDCKACAVGNICGGNDNWSYLFITNQTTQYREKIDLCKVWSGKTGIIEVKNEELLEYIDKGFVCYDYHDCWSSVSPLEYLDKKRNGVEAVQATGYTIDELAKVEYAFESSVANSKEGYSYHKNKDQKKGQFIGLSAALDVLAEIHEIHS